MFKHTFFGNGEHHSKEEIKEFIETTDKPLKYTYGLGYRGPATNHKSITKEEAYTIIKTQSLLDVDEYEDYVHLNAYSENDMW